MRDLLPEGEDLRRAVKWISAALSDKPEQPVQPLIHEAVFRFDLSPKDAEFLINLYTKK